MEPNAYPKPKYLLIVSFLLGSLVLGGVGALSALDLAAHNPTLRDRLGLASSGGTVTTHQEKLVLEENSAVINAVKKVSPAVVSVLATRNIPTYLGNYQQKGGGTGFILTSDGMILTNRHVISDERADYTVVTSDGKDYPAKVVAIDPSPTVDFAIIKIEATGLPTVELGDSDSLEIGQFVVAIGNALAEFQNTVTLGVVSAKDRQIVAGGPDGNEALEGLIQTDAAINPGNSGGPLVNLKGQVVGINSAAEADAQNIGFALPINLVQGAIDSYKKNGRIIRPYLGIRYKSITKELAKLNNLPVDQGALIVRGSDDLSALAVVPGSPADKAGLQEGDIIEAINDEQITEKQSLSRILQRYQVDDKVTLKIQRKGKEETIDVQLAELK